MKLAGNQSVRKSIRQFLSKIIKFCYTYMNSVCKPYWNLEFKSKMEGKSSSKKKDNREGADNVPSEKIAKSEENTATESKNTSVLDSRTSSDHNFPNSKNSKNTELFILICVIGACLGIILETIHSKLHQVEDHKTSQYLTKYWVYSKHSNVESDQGVLKHVHLVLNRTGFEKSTNKTAWSLLWSHDYPFTVLYPHLHRLLPHQRVNHFPGIGYIANKVNLATTKLNYIPTAFDLPQNKMAFLEYARKHKNATFLEKNNKHRGVFMKNASEVDLKSLENFVQEYVQKPFLVDGHKFDIGVYVVLTSVNPLRAYWYKGDVLFRYCPAKYYPFDPSVLDKYVIEDDYLPVWKVPSLAHTYTTLGYGMKDSFDVYVRSQGKDPADIWIEVERVIADILSKKEHHIVKALKDYTSPDNFFEMLRFDLILDEELKVYLLEANMSPNLSSAHYPPNQLLYEQVLYSLFSVTGVSSYLKKDKVDLSDQTASQNMISSQKNIATWGDQCNTTCRSHCGGEGLPVCRLCHHCMTSRMRSTLTTAHYEHLHRTDFRRLYPPVMSPVSSPGDVDVTGLSEANKLQMLWYQGKCNVDITWCT